jgi:dTDP-glucose pyrophosphorylase
MNEAAPAGVILAAGEGRRMGALGDLLPKACLPIVDRPLIARHFTLLQELGVREVVLVVGARRAPLERVARGWLPEGMTLRLTEQREPRGIADALSRVEELVGARFALLLGDTHFQPGDLGAGRDALAGGAAAADAVLSVRVESDPERIRRECSVRVDAAGWVIEIREKPARPFNALKPCGLYFFGRRIFDAVRATSASTLRGEVELTDAIQTLIDQGGLVRHAMTVRWDNNLNVPEDLLVSTRRVLDEAGLDHWIAPDAELHPGVTLAGACVGAGARVITPSSFRDCVILPGARVREQGAWESCVLGTDLVVQA